jgi:hypothetical protein
MASTVGMVAAIVIVILMHRHIRSTSVWPLRRRASRFRSAAHLSPD